MTLFNVYVYVYIICVHAGRLFPLKTSDILSHITTIVAEWHSLGIHLNMPYHVIEEIQANNPRDIVACKELSGWIEICRPYPLAGGHLLRLSRTWVKI